MSKLENTFAWSRKKKSINQNVDLSNYYNKNQVDTKISNLNNSLNSTNQLVNTNQTSITKLETTINKHTNKLQELAVEFDSNQSLVNDIHNQLSVYISTTNNYFSELDKKLSNEDKKLASRITQNEKDIALLKQSGGSGSGSIDTSNFAKLDSENNFSGTNLFYAPIYLNSSELYFGFKGGRSVALSFREDLGNQLTLWDGTGGGIRPYIPKTDDSIVHKRYVDTTIKPLQQSINQHQTQIAQNTADILDLKNKPSGGNVDLSNYYTIEQWDTMYQGMEMTGPNPIITDFGKKALLVFQVSTDNIKLSDFIGNLPSEIASWRNIANIESATVNAINVDNDILTKQLDLLISHYNGRLFIKSYTDIPSDVKHIRFRIWVNKK